MVEPDVGDAIGRGEAEEEGVTGFFGGVGGLLKVDGASEVSGTVEDVGRIDGEAGDLIEFRPTEGA